MNKSDIERAKREIDARRAAVILRHTLELQKLDNEEAEIETLEKSLGSCSQKFGMSVEAVAEKVRPSPSGVQKPAEPTCAPRSQHQRTNFEIFSHATRFGSF